MVDKRKEREKKKLKYTSAKSWAEKQDEGYQPTCIKLPSGKKFFKLKKTGIYKIDIIPYEVGEGNPDADTGMLHPERTYFRHRNLGPDGKSSYCCLAKNFKKKCPVCDWIMKNSGSSLVKVLYAQQRMLWNVIDLGDKDAGIQVWDTAYNRSFGEMLKNKILAADEYENYYHLEAGKKGGRTLQLTVGEQTWPGGKFNAVMNIEMLVREEEYEEEVVSECVCLDEVLVELSYKELDKIFSQGFGDDNKDEEEEERPKGKVTLPKRKPKEGDDEDEDDDQDDDNEEEDLVPAKGKKPSKDEEDEEEEDEDKNEWDEEEDEKPKNRKK